MVLISLSADDRDHSNSHQGELYSEVSTFLLYLVWL